MEEPAILSFPQHFVKALEPLLAFAPSLPADQLPVVLLVEGIVNAQSFHTGYTLSSPPAEAELCLMYQLRASGNDKSLVSGKGKAQLLLKQLNQVGSCLHYLQNCIVSRCNLHCC